MPFSLFGTYMYGDRYVEQRYRKSFLNQIFNPESLLYTLQWTWLYCRSCLTVTVNEGRIEVVENCATPVCAKLRPDVALKSVYWFSTVWHVAMHSKKTSDFESLVITAIQFQTGITRCHIAVLRVSKSIKKGHHDSVLPKFGNQMRWKYFWCCDC